MFPTQMWEPSKAMPQGRTPVGKVPRVAPSLARSLLTVLSPRFVTQMLAPSKGRISGDIAYRKLSEDRAVGGAQLGDLICRRTHNPEIGAIERNAIRPTSGRKV